MSSTWKTEKKENQQEECVATEATGRELRREWPTMSNSRRNDKSQHHVLLCFGFSFRTLIINCMVFVFVFFTVHLLLRLVSTTSKICPALYVHWPAEDLLQRSCKISVEKIEDARRNVSQKEKLQSQGAALIPRAEAVQ